MSCDEALEKRERFVAKPLPPPQKEEPYKTRSSSFLINLRIAKVLWGLWFSRERTLLRSDGALMDWPNRRSRVLWEVLIFYRDY
jgi:hypothetical protein